ncbi:MAG: hypothetical protein E7316_04630 [Clostridiales bacterium]|nr:hypothetical protein [Clostridiales bacterium]
MTQIPMSSFLAGIEAIAAEQPTYQPGHDGSDGQCDCIGLIIGALRRAGGEWNGIHGSNHAARNEMRSITPISNASGLSAGELVFKAHETSSAGYALPSRYDNHPDQLDYYHVGVVLSVSPLRIVHCTTPGIVYDARLGQWSHHGSLRMIAQEESPAACSLTTATVTAASGSTVNLRQSPGGALVERVPVGAGVTVTDRQDSWCRVTWGSYSGWMMSKYLIQNSAADQTDKTITLTLSRSDAERLRTALDSALEWEECP